MKLFSIQAFRHLLAGLCFFLLSGQLFATHTSTLGNNTQTAANYCAGDNGKIIHSFKITDSGVGVNNAITQITDNITGTWQTSDITNFKLYYTTTNVFATTNLLKTISGPATGTQTFSSLSVTLSPNGTTYYFWITADIASGASNGVTLIGGAMTTANFTSSNTKSGSATASGTMTVGATATLSSAAGTDAQTLGVSTALPYSITYAIGGSATGASASGLPTGVNGVFSAGTLTISGTPTVTGTFNYTVTTSGGACTAATATGTITVNAVSTSNCTTGTSAWGTGNISIGATSYYVACGNILIGNVSLANAASILCIDGCSSSSYGLWTGTFTADPTAGSTMNVYGKINTSSAWSFSSGGATINVYSGGSVTVAGLATSGGTYTINNWGTMTINGDLNLSAGTVTVNNYGTMTVTGYLTTGSNSVTFNNKSGSTLTVSGDDGSGNGIDIVAGTFNNSGTTTVTNDLDLSGGTFTNGGIFKVKNVNNHGGTNTNNGTMYVSGNFSSSTGWTNNSKIFVTGSISFTGPSTIGAGAYWSGASFKNTATITGPATGCSVFAISGNTDNGSGIISAANSSHVDICDAGHPVGGLDATGSHLNSTTFCTCYVLPITLVDFQAYPFDNIVKLEWITQTEINNDHFTVERSANGFDYESLDIIKGAGNTTKLLHYSANDAHPIAGTSYYRLRQTDFDGKTTVSEPVAVKLNGTSISVYPNPIVSDLNFFVFSSSRSDEALISILDVSGKTVFSTEETLSRGTTALKYDVSSLSEGLYILKVETADGVSVDRFLK